MQSIEKLLEKDSPALEMYVDEKFFESFNIFYAILSLQYFQD